jgi:hypothetical protein
MLNSLPAPLIGLFASLLLAVNSLFWVPLLLLLAMLKLMLPFTAVRRRLDPLLVRIAEAWIACNSGWMALTQKASLGCRRGSQGSIGAAGIWSTAIINRGPTSWSCSTC